MSGADLPDTGFGDARAAQLVVRHLRLRTALMQAQSSIAALLKLLDEEAQACRHARAASGEAGGLPEGDLESGIGGPGIDGIESQDMRQQQLLEGVNLILQFLDTLGVGVRHGVFSISYGARGNLPDGPAHRLSGDAK